MQLGKLALQPHVVGAGAGDVAGAAGAGAAGLQRLGHGSEHRGVLAHAEVVVRAPDGDALAVVAAVAHRARKAPRHPLEIGENAIAPFATERSEEHTSELQSLMRISYAV